ncbi:MAG: hypothetical protein FGM33_09815 [Candidatus Kapabacteria bacterium]|nr:hypothetical protein [Candidatus Kapabacteria bacterium]
MFRNVLLLLAALVAIAVFTGCQSDDNPTNPVTPVTYDSTGYAAATQGEFQLRSQMTALVALLKTARQPGVRLSQSEISTALLPLSSSIDPAFASQLVKYVAELADASGGAHSWQSRPGGSANGGTFGGYLFNEHGLEMEQMIDKGLYGAMFFSKASDIADESVNRQSIHRMLALFGANPGFPNTDRALVNPDMLAAAYCARRDQNDGKGMYSQIRREFVTAMSAAEGSAQAKSAAMQVLKLWERAIMATVINYTYTVIGELSASNPSDSSRALAMHAYGECVGFLTGWRYVNAPQRTITTEQIDELLLLLKAPLNGPWTCYEIWQLPADNLSRVVMVRERLQDIYGFSDEEMISFKTNWVATQGRK